jgi:hypothetical protein
MEGVKKTLVQRQVKTWRHLSYVLALAACDSEAEMKLRSW